jgi:transcriptional regulator NrdR family protein
VRPTAIVKRDGSEVPFDLARIGAAISKALHAVAIDDKALAAELARVVLEHLERTSDQSVLGIEEVQDAVVHVLQESGYYDAARAYIRYRDERERFRRERRALVAATGDDAARPNLMVVDLDGRRRQWDRGWLQQQLVSRYRLEPKAAEDALLQVEASLAGTAVSELSAPLVLSLVDAALVRCGMHSAAHERTPLRIDRAEAKAALEAVDGFEALQRCGRRVFEQLSLAECYPQSVVRLFTRGRLWIDGLDDPKRGSQYTATIDGNSNPWQVLTNAYSVAAEASRRWRRVRLVLPPSILGHLERGAAALVQPVCALASLAYVYLYCDGRTPLLSAWPFSGHRVSIATYNDDFLLLRQLQEMGLPMISGSHLMRGGYRARVAVELALNAQGLEGEFSQMDGLAMGLVAAARVRLAQLGLLQGGVAQGDTDVRFAIFGLTLHSTSNEYLERQVVQEGLRNGLTLTRSSNLPEEACAHLARLLE